MSKLSLSVEPTRRPRVATGPADIRDQRWLDERIAAIDDGMEAVLDIARNWSEGRNLSRLHPSTSAQEYILARIQPLGRGVVVPLLAESNWSNRQIAAVAGVDESTVRERLRENPQLERPAETLGADGALRPAHVLRVVEAEIIEPIPEPAVVPVAVPVEEPIDPAGWTALVGVMNALESFGQRDAASYAATVPERRRAATAKRLRKLGTYLGRIAWTLEGMEEPK